MDYLISESFDLWNVMLDDPTISMKNSVDGKE